MTELLYTHVHPTNERHLARACAVLANDGIIAYPTDVNWAIGCDPRSTKAMARIRALKPHHPKEQPFSLLCNSFSMMADFALLDDQAYCVLKKALPGPYTVLLKRSRLLPKQLKDKRSVVGVRIPEAPLILDLIAQFGHPLANTSMPAHPQQQVVLNFGYEIEEVFGHALDLILDLGEERLPLATTILDFSGDAGPAIVREGVGTTDFMRALLG